jgi:hypothetical protein
VIHGWSRSAPLSWILGIIKKVSKLSYLCAAVFCLPYKPQHGNQGSTMGFPMIFETLKNYHYEPNIGKGSSTISK